MLPSRGFGRGTGQFGQSGVSQTGGCLPGLCRKKQSSFAWGGGQIRDPPGLLPKGREAPGAAPCPQWLRAPRTGSHRPSLRELLAH